MIAVLSVISSFHRGFVRDFVVIGDDLVFETETKTDAETFIHSFRGFVLS